MRLPRQKEFSKSLIKSIMEVDEFNNQRRKDALNGKFLTKDEDFEMCKKHPILRLSTDIWWDRKISDPYYRWLNKGKAEGKNIQTVLHRIENADRKLENKFNDLLYHKIMRLPRQED